MMSEATAFYRSLSEVSTGDYPIRDAFQSFFPDYGSSHSISSEQFKAARCITQCKTGSLGYNISFCQSCGHIEIHACSCNNRNCPCCQSPQEQKWIMARNSELIEKCAYYHSIFTVPHELNDLMFENQKLLYTSCFPVLPILCLLCAAIKSTWVLLLVSSWFFIPGDSSLITILIFIAVFLVVGLQNQVSSLNPATRVFFFQ